MSARNVSLAMLVVVASLCRPAPAAACSCGGTIPTSVAAQRADVVFVGTVTRIDRPQSISRQNADGSVTVDVNGVGPNLVLFDIAHVYKGPALSLSEIAVVQGNSSCDFPFQTSQVWLVYGAEGIGGITTYGCSRTRLNSEASQDLVYLKGAEAKRPQGIVYGEVFRQGDGPGDTRLHALPDRLQVVAANRTQRFTTTTGRWGPFELVLPPGDFEVWVERGQKAVAPRRTVHVENGAEVKLQLLVEYSDAER
jgi:hypothetical protein